MKRKIKNFKEILAIVRRAQKKGLAVVSTNGCFDILHVGHVRNFEKAKALGDILIVGVNSDASVRANKGPSRPVVGEKERAEVVAALESVDHVFIFPERHVSEWLGTLKPDIHAKGKDYKVHEIMSPDALKKSGIRIVLVPLAKGKSTTALIKRISKLERSRG